MSTLHLNDQEDFYLILSNEREYMGRNSPIPEGPFTKGGGPVIADIGEMTSTEDQDVELDFTNPLVDINDVQYGLIVGGRPKSVRK